MFLYINTFFMKKILFIIWVSFYFISVTIAGIVYNSNTNITISNSTSETASLEFEAKLYDRYTTEYKDEDKRMYFNSWVLNISTYWDFEVYGKIDLIKQDSLNSACPEWETVSYSFVSTNSWDDFVSSDWWKGYKIDETSDNYFCPDSGSFSINLKSTSDTNTFFENITLNTWWEVIYEEITVIDNNGDEVTLDERILFSNARFAFDGMTNNEVQINNEFTGWNDSQIDASSVNSLNYGGWYDTSAYAIMMRNINKNIITYTKWKTWLDSTSLSSFSKEFMIYDYSWQESSASNEQNEWKILTINGWTDNKLWVSWEKNLIVKWWNLYIKSDIYNEDKDSILTIVVLRDDTKSKNGWNVYIDPSVTNIDAVIISEGSILSYDWTKVLTVDSDFDELKKQLLIYGSIATRNTIWENKTVFGTDHYEIKNQEETNSLYNLENIRVFRIWKASSLDSDDDTCYSSDESIIAAFDTSTWSIKNAFAWKKECYFNDKAEPNLRSTFRTASTVVEYNPYLQINPPKLLKN